MKNRKVILAALAVLLLALFFGAGLARWDGAGILWAEPTRQQPVIAEPAPVTEAQAQLADVMPTQAVLANLYDQVAPSVVNIQVVAQAGSAALPDLPFELPPGFEIPKGEPAPIRGQGSGFIYDDQGHIVTNNHVVEGATEIVVYFYNGMWTDAELVASDPAADLAVLKVTPPEGMEWRPLPLAASDSLRPGYYVVAMGSPFGLAETMTMGVVSALGRSFPTGDVAEGGSYSLPDVIQTDTAINPGNSGGPLLNLNGEVVGVNFAINSPVRANSGVGFAIPVSVVQKVVPALINEGEFNYAYLGIAGQTIDATVAEQNNLEANTLGVLVGSVVEGGPAAEAGVEAGDVIISIGGEPVTRFEDLVSYLFHQTNPGDTVELGVLRDGEQLTLSVTVSERPGPAVETPEERETAITIAEAVRIAREAVTEAGLMAEVESTNATQTTLEGRTVWSVTLTGDGKSATVIVDAQTGEVLELNVQ
ncbi:MAG TPA: trypsin-like peptidase domain-containing protein [Caldilineaceae bacterium]|nr:trypsin-like peptidase domain-containing protein [Caldilineaceae bacterium]